jgi:hypothetical protein
MVSTVHPAFSEIIILDEELQWEAANLRVINGDLKETRSEGGVQKREREAAGWERGRSRKKEIGSVMTYVASTREGKLIEENAKRSVRWHAVALIVSPFDPVAASRRHLLMLLVIEHPVASGSCSPRRLSCALEKSRRRKVEKWKGVHSRVTRSHRN